jgi:hypothetical protein
MCSGSCPRQYEEGVCNALGKSAKSTAGVFSIAPVVPTIRPGSAGAYHHLSQGSPLLVEIFLLKAKRGGHELKGG